MNVIKSDRKCIEHCNKPLQVSITTLAWLKTIGGAVYTHQGMVYLGLNDIL